jgi:hypothetical protein
MVVGGGAVKKFIGQFSCAMASCYVVALVVLIVYVFATVLADRLL